MKKFDRKIFLYAIIMIAAVLVLILFVYFSEQRYENMEDVFENQILIQEEKTELFQEKIKMLEEKNLELEKENKNLKKELNTKSGSSSNGETYQQSMKMLSEIYLLIESGEIEKAKAELERFDTSTFDDTVISFKKALENLVK